MKWTLPINSDSTCNQPIKSGERSLENLTNRMGKKAATNPRRSNKQHRQQSEESELELSDIDQFYKNRERIALEDDTVQHSDDYEDDSAEEVFGLNDDDDEEEEDEELDSEQEREVLARVPGLRKHLKKRGEDMESLSEGESSEEDPSAWGSRKSTFYNDDAEFDDEAIDDEVEEATKLQDRRLGGMNERDFMADEFSDSDNDDDVDDIMGARAAKADKSSKSATSSSRKEDEQILRDMDDELEKIDLMQDQDDDAEADEMDEAENKEAIMARLASESPELLSLVKDFKDKLGMVDPQIASLIARIKDGELSSRGGISLLDVKNQLMLNYLLNLCFYFFLKADSAKTRQTRVKDHPVIEKLVKLRLYLEKLKPLEQKLKPQLDRLVKSAVSDPGQRRDTSSAKSGYNYKADPSALALDDAHGNHGEDDEDTHAVYRPPKIAPMQYDSNDDQSNDDAAATAATGSSSRRRTMSKKSERIIREALQEFEDAPEEIVDAGNVYAANDAYEDREWIERARAEEEMMTRLPALKKNGKQLASGKNRLVDELEGLDDFGDFSFFNSADTHKLGGGGDMNSGKSKLKISSSKHNKNMNDSDGEEGSDNEYYTDLHTTQQQAKKAKLAHLAADQKFQQDNYYAATEEHEQGVEEGGKRNVNYEIMANKGLMPKRNKDQRNPRVKRRHKFEKSMIKLKTSVKPVMSTDLTNNNNGKGGYKGEQTGIKRNLARSVKF